MQLKKERERELRYRPSWYMSTTMPTPCLIMDSIELWYLRLYEDALRGNREKIDSEWMRTSGGRFGLRQSLYSRTTRSLDVWMS